MTDDQKQELIDQYREINVDHDWWDCVYDHFREDMGKAHITVDDMRFSGFWSQGDGASFTGYVNNNKAFFEEHKLAEPFPHMAKLLSYGGDFTLKIERSSFHYVHENTVAADVVFYDSFRHVLDVDDDLRMHIVEQWDEQLDYEYDAICDAVTEIIRDYCRDLYRRLNDEYDYLTSDEAVWDAIVANELDVIEEEETV